MITIDERVLRELGELRISTVINHYRNIVRIYVDGMYADYEITRKENGMLHLIPKEVSNAYENQEHEDG